MLCAKEKMEQVGGSGGGWTETTTLGVGERASNLPEKKVQL